MAVAGGNATAETVGDDLQDEALVMGEINEDSHSDDIADEGDNVIVESEKENENVLMAANDDEKLGAWYSTETEIFDNDHQDEVNYVSVGDSANIYNNIKTDGNMCNYLYSKPEVTIYVNGEQVEPCGDTKTINLFSHLTLTNHTQLTLIRKDGGTSLQNIMQMITTLPNQIVTHCITL